MKKKIRQIEELFNYYKNLEEYKKTVLKSIEEQGKLTPNLKTKILETKKDDRTGRFIPSLQKNERKQTQIKL